MPYKHGVTGSSPVGPIFGGVAQLARARGSYPRCQGFKSLLRYAGRGVKPTVFRGFTPSFFFRILLQLLQICYSRVRLLEKIKFRDAGDYLFALRLVFSIPGVTGLCGGYTRVSHILDNEFFRDVII